MTTKNNPNQPAAGTYEYYFGKEREQEQQANPSISPELTEQQTPVTNPSISPDLAPSESDAFRVRGIKPGAAIEKGSGIDAQKAKQLQQSPKPQPVDEVRQRIADGEEPYLALIQNRKPKKDVAKEANLRKAGRLTAITNALATLAGAIPGALSSGRGYMPQVQRSEEPFLAQLAQLEEDYDVANKEYEQLETSARMQDLSRKLSLADQAKAEEVAKAEKKEQRDYAEKMRKQQITDAQATKERDIELGNMYAAIGEGTFSGTFEEWMAMPTAKRTGIVKSTTDKLYEKGLRERTVGRTPKNTTPKNTVDLDFGNGQTFTVPKTVLRANLERLYNEMVRENPNLAAPKVATGRENKNLEMIYREPTSNEKYDYLIRNINLSPAAQRTLSSIVENQGKVGLKSVPTQSQNIGNGMPEREDYTTSGNFYQTYGEF